MANEQASQHYDEILNDISNMFTQINELQGKGVNIIDFAMNEPCFDTPMSIIMSGREALMQHRSKLPPIAGLEDLRLQICNYIDRTRGFRPKLEQIMVSPSNKQMLLCILLMHLKRGDEVVVTEPYMPEYNNIPKFINAKVKTINRLPADNFRVDLSQLNKIYSKKTKALLLDTPHNPTGNIMTNTELHEITEPLIGSGAIIISDESFSQIIHEGKHVSPAIFDRAQENTIILEDLSFTFSMPGWGLSFCIGPGEIIDKLRVSYLGILPKVPEFVQRAGIKALSEMDNIVPDVLKKYQKCRYNLVNGLNEIESFTCPSPAGGVHVFPDISGTNKTGKELAAELLIETGIAVLPGEFFSTHGEKHICMSFATAEENINEGLIRLQSRL